MIGVLENMRTLRNVGAKGDERRRIFGRGGGGDGADEADEGEMNELHRL